MDRHPHSPLGFSLDEALAVREARRARRWLLTSSVPTFYVLGSVLLPWLVVPALYDSLGAWFDQPLLHHQPRWMFMTLALALVGGAMATAFTRVSQIWQTERVRHTLEGWFLSCQQPWPLVVTGALAGGALALLVSTPGFLLLLGTAALTHVALISALLTLLLLMAGTALSAAAAGAGFFAASVDLSSQDPAPGVGRPGTVTPSGHQVIRSSSHPFLARQLAIAAGVALLAVLALWLRLEAVEFGWRRPWEEHPARLMLAVGLLTPAPSLMGFANRRWWVFCVVDRLDLRITPEGWALLLLLLYALGTWFLLRWSSQAYHALRADPERDRQSTPATAAEGEVTEAEARGYWAGFGNPVWTRELRTRLRGREAPQFIFFASVALAIGGFTPLVSAASQLGDPLAMAAVAREVFFWLGMTLSALIVLVTPGLTAEAMITERLRGTLELLLATPLRRAEILRGKLLGDLSVIGLLLSPSLPLFGFCYLFHGASGPHVLGIFLVLGLTALLCGMIGISASAIQTRSMAAKWQAYLLSLLFCSLSGGPFWLMYGLSADAVGATGSGLLLLTPLFMIVYGLVLAGLWSRACERLDYLDDLTI